MPLIHVWNYRGVEFGGERGVLQKHLSDAVENECEIGMLKNCVICLESGDSQGSAIIIVELLPIDPYCSFAIKKGLVEALGKAYKKFCSGEFHQGERRKNYYNGVLVIIREAVPASWPNYSDLVK